LFVIDNGPSHYEQTIVCVFHAMPVMDFTACRSTFQVMPVQDFTAWRSKISRHAGQDFTESQAGSF
jgi:hypothetical protein